MQKIIIYSVIILLSFISTVFAQDKSFSQRATEIGNRIEQISLKEKALLKNEIESIDKQIQEGTILIERANELKLKMAQRTASNIEVKVALEEQKLNQLIQDKVDGKIINTKDSITIRIGNRLVLRLENDSIKVKRVANKIERVAKEKRTTSQFVFAMGLNNLITEGQDLEDLDYKVWGSHFYEWGITNNTRIFKNDNLLHAKYGFSVMYNNLRPTDNKYFVRNGDATELQIFSYSLNESRFRNVQLVFPLHLEMDFTPKQVSANGDKTYFKTHKSFRVGLGGYGGFNIKSKQILKYKIDGDRVKDKQKGDFNVSNFVYGLSTYVGYGETSLYVKYDVSPFFKDNLVDQNNISLGIRFDFN